MSTYYGESFAQSMWDFDSNPITGYDDSKTFGENLSIIEGKIIPLIIYFYNTDKSPDIP